MAKSLLRWMHLLALTIVAGVLVYVAVGPHGVLPQHPLAAVGAGMIGLALIVEARRHLSPQPIQSVSHRHPPGPQGQERIDDIRTPH